MKPTPQNSTECGYTLTLEYRGQDEVRVREPPVTHGHHTLSSVLSLHASDKLVHLALVVPADLHDQLLRIRPQVHGKLETRVEV